MALPWLTRHVVVCKEAKPKKEEDAASIAARANIDIFAVEDLNLALYHRSSTA